MQVWFIHPPPISLTVNEIKQNFVNSLIPVIYTKVLGGVDACICIHICLCKERTCKISITDISIF